jgi:hypothetical protein
MKGRIKLDIKSRGICIMGTEDDAEEWPIDAGEGPSSSNVVAMVHDDSPPKDERLLIIV